MSSLNSFQCSCMSLAIGQALLVPALLPSVGQATTITVNTSSDAPIPAGCSLREALVLINNGGGPPAGCSIVGTFGSNDEVDFALSPQSIIALQQGELTITSTVSINGPGADQLTIDGNLQSGIFYINGAEGASIEGLTLTGGLSPYAGGALSIYDSPNVSISNSTITGNSTDFVGGGISFYNSESATISNSVISGNRSTGSAGGINLEENSDSIVISDSLLSGNSAAGNGGGIYFYQSYEGTVSNTSITNNVSDAVGGGLYMFGAELNIESSTISANTAVSGGGLSFDGFTSTIINSSISNNLAEDAGGGIRIFASTDVSISSSSVANNQAGRGGGLYFGASDAEIVNSTISSNTAIGASNDAGLGGGIMAYSQGGASINLFASTVNRNSVVGLNAQGGGLFAEDIGDIVLNSNNVVANSLGGDCNAVVASAGINWIEDNSCFGSGDGDPQVGPLQNNGGPTLTHAPITGSGLIGGGDLASCSNAPTNSLDQRGEPRGTVPCFIGAVEGVQEVLVQDEEDTTFFVIPLANGSAVIVEL